MIGLNRLPARAFGLKAADLNFKPAAAGKLQPQSARASLSDPTLTQSLNTSLANRDASARGVTPSLKFYVPNRGAGLLPGTAKQGAATPGPRALRQPADVERSHGTPAVEPDRALSPRSSDNSLNSLVFDRTDASTPLSFFRSLMTSTSLLPVPSASAKAPSGFGTDPAAAKVAGPQKAATPSGRSTLAPAAAMPASPTLIAGWQDNLSPAARILMPDAWVVGESHNVPGLPPGGNFALFDTDTGQPTYLGITPAASITPTGKVRLGPLGEAGVSIVGSNNTNDEAGVGLSLKVPTPIGDMLIFINLRQDALTAGNILDSLQGKVQRSITLSANVGAALSASDAAALGLNVVAPGAGAAVSRVFTALGADAWVGAAYRAQVVITPDGLKFKISGQEVSAEQLPQALAESLQGARATP